MKKLILVATGLITLAASSASGADIVDLAVRGVRPGCPAAWFSGWYGGIDGGGYSWTAHRGDRDGFLNLPETGAMAFAVGTQGAADYVQQKNGVLVGGNIGYNWTRCNTLFGLEVQGDWMSGTVTSQVNPNFVLFPVVPGAGGNWNVSSRLNSLITFRARSGIVMDNLLLYVTGGLAAARFHTTYTAATTSGTFGVASPFGAVADFSETKWGWTAGFGVEYAWTDRISIKSETLYASFPDRTMSTVVSFPAAFVATGFFPPADTKSFTHSDSVWVSKIGIEFKLDSVPLDTK